MIPSPGSPGRQFMAAIRRFAGTARITRSPPPPRSTSPPPVGSRETRRSSSKRLSALPTAAQPRRNRHSPRRNKTSCSRPPSRSSWDGAAGSASARSRGKDNAVLNRTKITALGARRDRQSGIADAPTCSSEYLSVGPGCEPGSGLLVTAQSGQAQSPGSAPRSFRAGKALGGRRRAPRRSVAAAGACGVSASLTGVARTRSATA